MHSYQSYGVQADLVHHYCLVGRLLLYSVNHERGAINIYEYVNELHAVVLQVVFSIQIRKHDSGYTQSGTMLINLIRALANGIFWARHLFDGLSSWIPLLQFNRRTSHLYPTYRQLHSCQSYP